MAVGAIASLGAAAFKSALDAKRAGEKYRAVEKDRKFRKEVRDEGYDLMRNPTGIGVSGAEGMRAGATQTLMGATRGLEADARRDAAAARGGSRLAALSILAKTRTQGLTDVERNIADANVSAKKAQMMRGAQMVDAAGDVTPTTKPKGFLGRFVPQALGSIAQMSQAKRSKMMSKATDAGTGMTQMS